MCYLNKITQNYIWIGSAFYLILLFTIVESFNAVTMTNIVMFTAFAVLLYKSTREPETFYTQRHLFTTVFFYTLCGVAVMFALSYSYNGNTFCFSERDARLYYDNALKMAKWSFSDIMTYLSRYWEFEDWGGFIVPSMLMHLIAAKWFVNLVNVFIGSLTALTLFDIGTKIMSRRYAYMATLAYCTASFTIFFHATFLKESMFLFFVIMAFGQFYKFLEKYRIWNLIGALLCSGAVFFYRPVVVLFLWMAMGSYFMFNFKKVAINIAIVLVLGTAVYFASTIFNEAIMKYTANTNFVISNDEEQQESGNGTFYYATHIASAMIGTFPTLTSTNIQKTSLSLCGAGVFYKFLLAIFFWLGGIFIILKRYRPLYPLFAFCLIEGTAVVIAIDALELRKSLPHIPMFIMTAFWFMDQIDNNPAIQDRWRHAVKIIFPISMAITFGVTLLWNFR